jgi:hypothetical protein
MSLFGLIRDAISKSREYAEALHYYERALDAEPEDERRRPRIVQEALRAVLKPDWDGVAAMKSSARRPRWCARNIRDGCLGEGRPDGMVPTCKNA